MLWRREMVTGSYAPRWVRIVTREGGRGWAVAFVINHDHPRYAGLLPEDAHRRMPSRGPKGRSAPAPPICSTPPSHLEMLGIRDPRLFRLRDLVTQALEGSKKNPRISFTRACRPRCIAKMALRMKGLSPVSGAIWHEGG